MIYSVGLAVLVALAFVVIALHMLPKRVEPVSDKWDAPQNEVEAVAEDLRRIATQLESGPKQDNRLWYINRAGDIFAVGRLMLETARRGLL